MTTVRTLLKHKGEQVHTIAPDASVENIAAKLHNLKIGALLVTGSTQGKAADIIGIVSERDVVAWLATGGTHRGTTAEELATQNLTWATCDTSVSELATLMTTHRIRHIPVRTSDGEKLAGMISIGDVVAWHLRELEDTTSSLSTYITTGRG